MKHIVKLFVVTVVLFGSTASAFAHVSGGDPRPRAVVAEPVSVLSALMTVVGLSGL